MICFKSQFFRQIPNLFIVSAKTIRALIASSLLVFVNSVSANTIATKELLGTIVPGTPANEANEAEMVRFLLANLATHGAAVSYSGAGINLLDNPADPISETYTLWKPADLGSGFSTATPTYGAQVITSNTTLNLGSFTYDYILAKFGQDSEVFYIGNLSGTITIPDVVNTNGLSHYLLFNQHGASVPDGGLTVGLLGLAMIGLAVIRHRFAPN